MKAKVYFHRSNKKIEIYFEVRGVLIRTYVGACGCVECLADDAGYTEQLHDSVGKFKVTRRIN